MKKLVKLMSRRKNALFLCLIITITTVLAISINRIISVGIILGVFGISFTAFVPTLTEEIKHRDLLISIAASTLGVTIGLIIANAYITANNNVAAQNRQTGIIEPPSHIAELSPTQNHVDEVVNEYPVNEGYSTNTNEKAFLTSNGIIKGKEDLEELSKIGVLIESIKLQMIDNHEIRLIDSEELHKSTYEDYLDKANTAFDKYKAAKGSNELGFDDRIEMLVEALDYRKLAHQQIKTYKNCELIGQYYIYLAEEYLAAKVTGEAYNFYNKAIEYYLQAYKLSIAEGTIDYSLIYNTAICFSNISDIADIDSTVYRDSLYMSIAYYSLYREKDPDHYKNQFYLARGYKMLAMQADDIYMCQYLLIAKDEFYKCTVVEKLKIKDRITIYDNIYNIIDLLLNMDLKYLEPDTDIEKLEEEKLNIDNTRKALSSQL